MKALVSTLVLAFSISTMATTATEGLKTIVEAGTFKGTDCTVTVSHSQNVSTVHVTQDGTTEFFSVMDITSSTNYSAHFIESTGEVYGHQVMRFPRYLDGGVKNFHAKKLANGKATISVSTILLDHRGNDASTYATCEFSK